MRKKKKSKNYDIKGYRILNVNFHLTSCTRWYRKLCFYYKIRHNDCPQYLAQLLPTEQPSCYIVFVQIILHLLLTSVQNFKSSFFPSCIFNLNQLDPAIQNSSSLEIFKRTLLKFIRLKQLMCTRFTTREGWLTRLRLGLSHLREHKFRHNFNETIDPFCLCGTNSIESSEHFLLHCPTFALLRIKVFDNLRNFTFCKVYNYTNSSIWI